jgi:hypothetical protein
LEILVLALLFAGALLAWFLSKKRQRQAPLPADPTIRFQGSGRYEFAVIGVSRYRPALEKIYGNDDLEHDGKQVEAVLVLENTNPHDNKAVRVDVQGRTIGYLPGDLAREYRRRLDEGGYLKVRGICKAKISSRLYRSIGGADFTVRLDLPPKRASQ